MNDIGPFQDIIAVGWGESQIEASDSGWTFTERFAGSVTGTPFGWTVEMELGVNPNPSSLEQDVARATRDVVFDRAFLVEVTSSLSLSGQADSAIISTDEFFYRESLNSTVMGTPNGSYVAGAGSHSFNVSLSDYQAVPTGRSGISTFSVTFTFTPI